MRWQQLRGKQMTIIKYLRQEKNLTQEQLENQSGVKRWKIALAEKGLFKLEVKDLQALVRVLGGNSNSLLNQVNFPEEE